MESYPIFHGRLRSQAYHCYLCFLCFRNTWAHHSACTTNCNFDLSHKAQLRHMSSDKLALSPQQQAAVSPSTCVIGDLSDADLAAIFQRLPLLDRLLISEVCKRWCDISRLAWLDVKHLDLGPIPGQHIAAIVKQCPNLQTAFAQRKTFDSDQLHILSRVNLSALKLFGCEAKFEATPERISDAFSAVFSNNLQSASWQELALVGFGVETDLDYDYWTNDNILMFPATFPSALKRLCLSGVRWSPPGGFETWLKKQQLKYGDYVESGSRLYTTFLSGLETFQNLECLCLHSEDANVTPWMYYDRCSPDESDLVNIGALTNLRELYLGSDYDAVHHGWHEHYFDDHGLGKAIFSLPQLEVLFLSNVRCEAKETFKKLATKHPTLRILMLAGAFFDEVEIPARVRYPNGFGSDSLPTLHIFLGWCASRELIFTKSTSDAAKIYPINAALPEYLEREDIKPIFEGVWIAEKIKEAASCRAAGFPDSCDLYADSVRYSEN